MIGKVAASLAAIYLLFRKDSVDGVPFSKEINDASGITGVSATMIAAIIRVESDFQPFAVGQAGEVGLMQIKPGAWADSNRHNGWNFDYGLATNPKINILVGAGYLKYLYDTCSSSTERVIRAYNKGCSGSKNGEGQEYLDEVKSYL